MARLARELSQAVLVLVNRLYTFAGYGFAGQAKGVAAPVVVCNAEHRFVIAEQLRGVGIHDARIILEPVGRNSAPAIAAAAFVVAEHNPDAVLWVMAADAAIQDVHKLHVALEHAVTAAKAGYVVTFGMAATRPETGYGYIEQGAALAGMPEVYSVTQFVEKPDKGKAAAFLAQGVFVEFGHVCCPCRDFSGRDAALRT